LGNCVPELPNIGSEPQVKDAFDSFQKQWLAGVKKKL
jgi:hypothetical protein